MLYAVLVRTLREGVSYDEFRRAWLPEGGYGAPVTVVTGTSVENPRQVITIGRVDLPIERLGDALAVVAERERQRHDQVDDVIESTQLSGIFEQVAEDDLS